MQMHQTGAQDEGTNRIRIALFLPGEYLAQHRKRIGRRVRNNPSEGCGYFNGPPATIRLDFAQIFPFVELDLGGD
jgi:hypothetical protein